MKKENMKAGRSIDHERETRVLLENMQSGIKVIAEGHGGIISRLDRVESELHTIKICVFDMDSRLTKVESKLDTTIVRLDTTIAQNEDRFRHIEKKLALA